MFPRQHAELHRLEVRPSMKDPECGRPTAERLKVNFSHCYRNCAWEGGREGGACSQDPSVTGTDEVYTLQLHEVSGELVSTGNLC